MISSLPTSMGADRWLSNRHESWSQAFWHTWVLIANLPTFMGADRQPSNIHGCWSLAGGHAQLWWNKISKAQIVWYSTWRSVKKYNKRSVESSDVCKPMLNSPTVIKTINIFKIVLLQYIHIHTVLVYTVLYNVWVHYSQIYCVCCIVTEVIKLPLGGVRTWWCTVQLSWSCG